LEWYWRWGFLQMKFDGMSGRAGLKTSHCRGKTKAPASEGGRYKGKQGPVISRFLLTA